MKNYLPENMGFPIRSFGDMVPDSLLICPATYSDGSSKQVGLRQRICATCGKQFEATEFHRYRLERKINGKNKMRWYCSYSCFRPAEKREAEVFKYKAFGITKEYDPSKDTVERAHARLEQCRKTLADIRHEIYDDPIAFRAMSENYRKNMKNKEKRWMENVAFAEQRVREVEGYEPEDE